MTAMCWGHVVGVASVVHGGKAAPNPLGACFECGVFGCSEHAERDAGSGKWICFQSVADAIAASAGLEGGVDNLGLTSSEDLEIRFPVLAEATAGWRNRAREAFETEPTIPPSRVSNVTLLGDAVGIAQALMGVEPGESLGAGFGEQQYRWVQPPTRVRVDPHGLFSVGLADLLSDLETEG